MYVSFKTEKQQLWLIVAEAPAPAHQSRLLILIAPLRSVPGFVSTG